MPPFSGKFHSVDLGSPLGTMAFFLFFFFQLALWMCSHLEPAGAVEVLLPFYLFPGCCPLEHCVFNLWHGFPFLVVNRPLTLLLEKDPGLICSPSLLSLHSLALCCMHAHASSKIKSWKWVYKLTLEQYGSQGHWPSCSIKNACITYSLPSTPVVPHLGIQPTSDDIVL